jgi:hypothetical protein
MDLTDLKDRIDRARAEMEAPLKPGESRPVMPVTAYLDEEDSTVLWVAVRAIREEHPATFNRYPETALATSIIAVLGDLPAVPTLAELAEYLQSGADEQGPWLISTPLANLALPDAMVAVTDDVVLQRAFLSPEVGDDEYNAEVDAHAGIYKVLGDYVNPPARWLRPGRHGDGALDTTRTAALLTLEHGTPALAASRARAKAMYAIAVWSIVKPPADMMLLPDLGIYGPQPFLHMPQRIKAYDQGQWITKKHARPASIEHWSEYEIPAGDLLRLPFDALEVVREKRSAQALLSACWATFEAARGSRFILSERLRHVLVAVETLGEPKPGKTMKWKRWERISRRYDVHERLQGRGYTEEAIANAEKRLKTARNIATHGADAALIDLGFPEGAERALRYGKPAAGDDLGFSALSADLTIMIYAVQHVLDNLLRHMNEHGWNDDEFEKQFAPESA